MGSYWEDSVSHHPFCVFFWDFWGRFFVSVGIEVKRFTPSTLHPQSTKSLGRPGSAKSLSSCCQVLKVWLNFQAWSSQRNTLILGKKPGVTPPFLRGVAIFGPIWFIYSFDIIIKNIINNSEWNPLDIWVSVFLARNDHFGWDRLFSSRPMMCSI